MNWAKTCAKYSEANFYQSPQWAKVNELIGAKTVTKELMDDGWLLAIVRKAKRGRYLEIPCGPLINWQNKAAVKEAMDSIVTIAKENRCVFVRLRPQLLASEENLKLLKDLGLRPSPMHLAAEHTVIIDLKKYGSIEENYQNLSNNFLLIDMLKNNSVISRNQILNNNFKGFKIGILYLCQEGDENCLLRKEDETQNFYYVTLKYKTFNLTHQNEIPLQASNEYSIEKYPFYFNYTSGTVVY